MKEIIDIDKLFEKFVRAYLVKNKGNLKEGELTDRLSEIYSQFESEPNDRLGGLKPKEYFTGEEDIVSVWLEYIKRGVPLNDYVLDAVVENGKDEDVVAHLNENEDEQVLLSGIEIMRRKNVKSAVDCYIDLLFSKKVCHHVKDEIVEDLIYFADDVSEKLLERVCGGRADGAVCEILSRVTKKDERIKRILLDGLKRGDKVPEYSAYLIHYDDESCVDEMKDYLSGVTDYVSYKELKMAIEALGGTADDNRDFSLDKDYKKLTAGEDDSN